MKCFTGQTERGCDDRTATCRGYRVAVLCRATSRVTTTVEMTATRKLICAGAKGVAGRSLLICRADVAMNDPHVCFHRALQPFFNTMKTKLTWSLVVAAVALLGATDAFAADNAAPTASVTSPVDGT